MFSFFFSRFGGIFAFLVVISHFGGVISRYATIISRAARFIIFIFFLPRGREQNAKFPLWALQVSFGRFCPGFWRVSKTGVSCGAVAKYF